MRLSTQASRAVKAFALTATTAVAVVACGGTTSGGNTGQAAPASQQVYRYNPGVEPNSWDVGQQSYSYEASAGRLYTEALLRPTQDLKDVSGLAADRWNVSSDGLTYTFHIRSNAKWSDGKPVTGSDFVYAWQRMLDPALAASYTDPFFDQTIAGAANYGNVSATDDAAITSYINGLGLSAPDPSTFQVKLAAPAPYFKWVATLWVSAPIRKDLVAAANGGTDPKWSDVTGLEKWAQTPTSVVGNGPFKISEEVPKDHLTLVANPYAWDKPTFQTVTQYFISDGNTAFAKYRTGELDQINVPLADTQLAKTDPVLKKQLLIIHTLAPWWMSYNTKRPYLSDPRVRLALTKSIDRNKLCADVEQGRCSPLLTLLPAGFPGQNTSAGDVQKFDPTAAKNLLQQAGVTPAQLGTLKLLTRDSTGSRTINQFIAAQWQTNLGANIQLDVLDSKTVTHNIRKGNFDIYGPDGWGFDYPDAQDIFGNYTTQACHAFNWGCWSYPQYDDLLKTYNSDLNASKRTQEGMTLQKYLDDQAPIGFLYQSTEYDLVKPYVHLTVTIADDEYTPGDFFFGGNGGYIVKH